TFLGNLLINGYAKCDLIGARQVFDEMPERNVSTWSSMISGYTQCGYGEESWVMFVLFRRECDERVNEYVLASVVRGVTRLGSVVKGCLLHSLVVKSGLGEDVYVGTSVVDFYCKVGRVEDARVVFDGLVVKNAVTWTTMIAGYARVGKSEVSLELLSEMKEIDVVPDRYVLSSALSACSILGFLEGGKQIHGFVLRR
ncbi:pentatricopeptide repeat-containing protein, partial [Tanacetum coccineum]